MSDREENDFYATEPKATELLLEKETFNKNILEPCAGKGHIRDVLVSNGYNLTATDLIYRGIGEMGEQWCNDFFSNGNKGHYTPTMRNLCLYENGCAKIRFSRILIQRKKDCEK